MLVRPSGLFLEDLVRGDLLTKENYGSVDGVFIGLEDDEVMVEEFQRWMVDKSPTKEVRFISGAGHMVMLSKPKELCQLLQDIADKYTMLYIKNKN